MPLSRRELLRAGAVGAFVSAVPECGLAVSGDSVGRAPVSGRHPESAAMAALPLPPEVELEIRMAYLRYRRWKGKDETVVFPIVTDLHDGHPDIAVPPDWSQTKMHVLFAERAAAVFKADFLAELGDYGPDRDAEWKPVGRPVAERRFRSQEILLGASPVPVIACLGNHDLINSKFSLPSGDFGRRFIGAQKAAGIPFVTGPDESYGYLDLPSKRLRAIFMNTTDTRPDPQNGGRRKWRGISDAQAEFVAEALKLPSPDWSAVAFSHIPLCPGLGRVVGVHPGRGDDMANRARTLLIIEDFVRKGGRFLGMFSGHAHQDWDARERGVTHFVSQGCGTCPYTWLLPESRYTHRGDPGCSMGFDVVALKPGKNSGCVFRVGAGGAAFDRPFPHAAYGSSYAEITENRVNFVCPSWLHPMRFRISDADFAGNGIFSSEVRDGIRFVRLDISAGWIREEALAFLRCETEKGDLTAVLLNRPLWTPGRPDVPFGNPAARKPPQPWRNYELRDHIVRKMPNLLGVFVTGDGYALSVQNGRAQVARPRGGTLEVSINGSDLNT